MENIAHNAVCVDMGKASAYGCVVEQIGSNKAAPGVNVPPRCPRTMSAVSFCDIHQCSNEQILKADGEGTACRN